MRLSRLATMNLSRAVSNVASRVPSKVPLYRVALCWVVLRSGLLPWLALLCVAISAQGAEVDFDRDIAPILAARCSSCHGPASGEGGLRLVDRASAMVELDSGSRAIVPGEPEQSVLLDRVRSSIEGERMPPKGEPLTTAQIARLETWIEQGASWPEHWAYRPLERPVVPVIADPQWAGWSLHPIDRFVLAQLLSRGLNPSAEASKAVLLRRVSLDLTGLPPTPNELEAFLTDSGPMAYERAVERLLASPRYGERWARHWMDLVHFAETHGNDQDRPREHAWPYRDYLIQSFNNDKPFARFVEEQIAGEALFPDSAEAIVATGMLAAGPWDESSLRDIREDTVDRAIARYLDRDDIVSTVVQTFLSSTVHCARCHDHKFDPISQQEYYGLQAIFAGVDKGTRAYDRDPSVARRRTLIAELQSELKELAEHPSADVVAAALARLEPATFAGSDPASVLKTKLHEWEATLRERVPTWQVVAPEAFASASGSTLELQPDASVYASGTRPETDTYTLTLRSPLDRITGLRMEVLADPRLPLQGPGRQDNGNLHLNEVLAFVRDDSVPEGKRRVAIQSATADFNQDGWTIEMAIDGNSATAWGIHPAEGQSHWATLRFAEPLAIRDDAPLTIELQQTHGRGHLIGRVRVAVTGAAPPWAPDAESLPADIGAILRVAGAERTAEQYDRLATYYYDQHLREAAAALPPPAKVYCGSNRFEPDGSFRPTDTPRVVHVLERGDVQKPLAEAAPAALSYLPSLPAELDIQEPHNEGARRAAFARWVTDRRNVLTWRSIVNRLWQHHFERGLVDTPNDFGHLGSPPTHPELLDWLALELQENGGSLKALHRILVTSRTYRQASEHDPARAAQDSDNRYLWKMPRRRLDAESLRDAMLQIAGNLDLQMGGPSVRQFIQSPGIHVTPNVDYQGFQVDEPAHRRRSVYRFLFRTLPDPFMDALDCPDASQLTPQRSSSVTALQALALLNDNVLVHCSQLTAERLAHAAPEPDQQIAALFRAVLLREPSAAEHLRFGEYVERFGLANAVRVLLNSNEFVFVD